MSLNFFKYLLLVFVLSFATNLIYCQNHTTNNNKDFTHLKKEDLNKNSDEEEQKVNEIKITNESGLFSRKRSFSNNDKTKVNSSSNPKQYRTKIGSLFTRIGNGIKRYCNDNNISAKRLLRITKLFL